jgi:hypothetical protein
LLAQIRPAGVINQVTPVGRFFVPELSEFVGVLENGDSCLSVVWPGGPILAGKDERPGRFPRDRVTAGC